MPHKRSVSVASRRDVVGDGGQQDGESRRRVSILGLLTPGDSEASSATPHRQSVSPLSRALSVSTSISRSPSVQRVRDSTRLSTLTPQQEAEVRRTLSQRLSAARKRFEEDREREEEEYEREETIYVYLQNPRQTIADVLRGTAQLEAPPPAPSSTLPPLPILTSARFKPPVPVVTTVRSTRSDSAVTEATIEDSHKKDWNAVEPSEDPFVTVAPSHPGPADLSGEDTSFTTLGGETLVPSAQTSFGTTSTTQTTATAPKSRAEVDKLRNALPRGDELVNSLHKYHYDVIRPAVIHPFPLADDIVRNTGSRDALYSGPFQPFALPTTLPVRSYVAHNYILGKLEQKWTESCLAEQLKSEVQIAQEVVHELGGEVTNDWGAWVDYEVPSGFFNSLKPNWLKKREEEKLEQQYQAETKRKMEEHLAREPSSQEYQSAWALAFLQKAEEREKERGNEVKEYQTGFIAGMAVVLKEKNNVGEESMAQPSVVRARAQSQSSSKKSAKKSKERSEYEEAGKTEAVMVEINRLEGKFGARHAS